MTFTTSDDDAAQPAPDLGDNPFTYTGQRLDPESGLMYYKHRYYDTARGRFLSRDPYRSVDPKNVYEYVLGRVTTYIDPLGLVPESGSDTELEVSFSATGHDAGAFDDWLNLLSNRPGNEVDILDWDNGMDILTKLKEWSSQGTDECPTCIKKMFVFSHAWLSNSALGKDSNGGVYSGGSARGFIGRKNQADSATPKDVANSIKSGQVRFCEKCTITFTGCYVGAIGSFVQDLATATGCEVVAATGASSGAKAPTFGTFADDYDPDQGPKTYDRFFPALPNGDIKKPEKIGSRIKLW